MQVGIFEAKTHLSQLLNRVGEGEEITITRKNIPIAKLIPFKRESKARIIEAIAGIRALRKSINTDELPSVKEMIEEGRRY